MKEKSSPLQDGFMQATWRMGFEFVSVGSPPFISHGKAIWKRNATRSSEDLLNHGHKPLAY